MIRFAWRQLVRRKGPAATLTVGFLVAAVSFTLLTSAATTGALEVKGTIAKNWRNAYDILVRPGRTYSPLERADGLVADDYLSGIFGGITLNQWRQVLSIPGVAIAAPVANLGYVVTSATVTIHLGSSLNADPRQIYRIRLAWAANGGSVYPGSTPYVYVSRLAHDACPDRSFGAPTTVSSPFDLLGPQDAYLTCFDRDASGEPVARVTALFPALVAAIDPVQEGRLLGLVRTIVVGRGLRPTDTLSTSHLGSVVPVVASTRTYVDETLQATIERLSPVDVPRLLREHRAYRVLSTLPGTTVARQTFSSASMYETMLRQLEGTTTPSVGQYWTAGAVGYQRGAGGSLIAEPTESSPDAVWSDAQGFGGYFSAPPGNQDVQVRDLSGRPAVLNAEGAGAAQLKVVGRFDPARLPGFSALSSLPLESYYPPRAEPADAASRAAMHGRLLLPTMNIGGYLAQPPAMLTTINAASGFTDPRFFEGADARAPISVIRVRVAGGGGPDPVSRERVRLVALAIRKATALAVDITAGSSPQAVDVRLPAGRFGLPSLLVREGWVKKGVAVVFLRAVDRKSVALFVLVLLVCGLFLLNTSFASIRARREEIGVLRCMGWTKERVFAAVLAEIALAGLVAGLLGTAVAVILTKALSLSMPPARSLLVAPVAVILAVAAGLIPARRAARSQPIDAVRPDVGGRAARRAASSIRAIAFVNIRRLPGRTLLGAGGLLIGVAALAVLLSINLAFQGALIGTLLGQFISVQARSVDYVSTGLAIALGGMSIANVLVLNVRERTPELHTLRAVGWRAGHIRRLVLLEGLAIGTLGSVSGSLLGVALAAALGEAVRQVVIAALLAATGGVAVTMIAATVPASFGARLIAPRALAEEW